MQKIIREKYGVLLGDQEAPETPEERRLREKYGQRPAARSLENEQVNTSTGNSPHSEKGEEVAVHPSSFEWRELDPAEMRRYWENQRLAAGNKERYCQYEVYRTMTDSPRFCAEEAAYVWTVRFGEEEVRYGVCRAHAARFEQHPEELHGEVVKKEARVDTEGGSVQ